MRGHLLRGWKPGAGGSLNGLGGRSLIDGRGGGARSLLRARSSALHSTSAFNDNLCYGPRRGRELDPQQVVGVRLG